MTNFQSVSTTSHTQTTFVRSLTSAFRRPVTLEPDPNHLDMIEKINAINRSQAVIEFLPDGTIIDANDNFLRAMGYSQEEVVGKHHRIFVERQYAESQDYIRFWEQLNAGEFTVAEFKRIAKGGREVYIQASYNPIFDANRAVVKIIKFATDTTHQVQTRHQTQEIGESIAHSVNELASTIQEIAGNVHSTAMLAEKTDAVAKTTVEKALTLEASSTKIAQVVSVIQGLAAQTNLLALNATIESARAGEAGLGFAVVAKEVKDLANSTSEATENIETIIASIQAEVVGLLESIQEISTSVSEVTGNTNSTAAAVEEQSVTSSGLSETANSLLALNRK